VPVRPEIPLDFPCRMKRLCDKRGGVRYRIEITENEWVKACNLCERYWLYVVYECATAQPRLLRIQDPVGKLIVRAKGGVVIAEQQIFAAATQDEGA
jgi:Domain of unknown function (DUF3883)